MDLVSFGLGFVAFPLAVVALSLAYAASPSVWLSRHEGRGAPVGVAGWSAGASWPAGPFGRFRVVAQFGHLRATGDAPVTHDLASEVLRPGWGLSRGTWKSADFLVLCRYVGFRAGGRFAWLSCDVDNPTAADEIAKDQARRAEEWGATKERIFGALRAAAPSEDDDGVPLDHAD